MGIFTCPCPTPSSTQWQSWRHISSGYPGPWLEAGRANLIHRLFCMPTLTCLRAPWNSGPRFSSLLHLMQKLLGMKKQHALLKSTIRPTNYRQSVGAKDYSWHIKWLPKAQKKRAKENLFGKLHIHIHLCVWGHLESQAHHQGWKHSQKRPEISYAFSSGSSLKSAQAWLSVDTPQHRPNLQGLGEVLLCSYS